MLLPEEVHNSLKRDFDQSFSLEKPFYVSPERIVKLEAIEASRAVAESMPTPPISFQSVKREPSPARSTTSSLTDPSTTPSYRQPRSLANSAFAAMNGSPSGSAPPPAKKKKLTFTEKEDKRIQREIKDAERAAEKAKKDAERQVLAEDKAKRDAEKEAERKKREQDRENKRLANEAEKAARAEKVRKNEEAKRLKEEEKQRLEEEKRKKERSQKTLNSFFNIPKTKKEPEGSASPVASTASLSVRTTPSKTKALSPYEKLFPSFYVRADVKVARMHRFERDEDGLKALQHTIDSYISAERETDNMHSFDATSLFHIMQDSPRGKQCLPVREIMAELHGNAAKPIDLTGDSQNFTPQVRTSRDLLRTVPLKFLKFAEDVRPPYRGTYSSNPRHGLRRLAQNPWRKDNLNTDYDSDSEAEWVEDENGEDCSDGEEDDEPVEDGEDMDGFLDDENDDTAHSKRSLTQNDLQPVSTGVCWEDERRRNTYVKMMPYRMEFILDQSMKSIDPFSTSYLAPPVPATTTNAGTMNPPTSRAPLHTMKSVNTSAPPSSAPSNNKTASANPNKPAPKLLDPSDLPAFKNAIEGSPLSKIGLIEVLKKDFPGRTAAAIRATLEKVARREGKKESYKRWVLIGEAEG